MNKARIAVKTLFFINGFLYSNLASRLPRLQEIFGLSNSTLGIILLSTSVGAVCAMPFTGWLILKNGSHRIGMVSVITFCIIFPFVTWMPGVPGLISLFFMMGVTAGMLDISMNAQAVMVEQALGKPIMTSFHALFSIGMAGGAFCGSFFEELNITLSDHLLWITLFCLFISFFSHFHLIKDRPNTHEVGPKFRLPNAAMVSIGFIAFCCMMGEGAMADWSTNYMENIANANKVLAPIGLSAFAVAMTTGRIFGDSARSRFGDRSLMIVCGSIATSGLLFSLIFLNPFLVIVGFSLVGLGLSVIVPITYSIAGNSNEVSTGVGLAMVTTVGYTGFLFGPPLIGFFADWISLRAALVSVVILFSVMTILSFKYRGGRK